MNKAAVAGNLYRGLRLIFTCGLVAVVALALAPAMVANAATIQVINNNDSGAGSLRQAIADAIPGEEITFAGTVTGTITLTTGQLSINKNLTITGPGADILTISGNNASRVFNIGSGVTVTISGLTIANGNTSGDFGGGIYNYDGTVTLDNCTVSGNTADAGGGIYNDGTLTLNNCTVNGNIAFVGGGICNEDTITLNNSTVSGNTAAYYGGGIYNDTTLTLNNCTVSGNTAAYYYGGGIYNNGGSANVKNSIIAGNNAGAAAPDCGGTLNSYGCNLVEDTSGCTIIGDETCNIYGEDPLLGPLQDNDGPTFTHALLEGSPAIDAVCTDCGCTTIAGQQVTTDQRGEPRPADGDGDGIALCDIGSYELQPPPLPPPGPPGVPTVNHWGIVAMITLFAGLLVWAVRRRLSASRMSD